MGIKTAVFQSHISLHEWKKRMCQRIAIISVSAPAVDFGYDVSIKLRTPNIEVSYIDFSESG